MLVAGMERCYVVSIGEVFESNPYAYYWIVARMRQGKKLIPFYKRWIRVIDRDTVEVCIEYKR